MKALVIYGKDGNFGFTEDYPEPKIKDGWAKVKVEYSGVCGSDIARFAHTGSYRHPMVLGHEFSGTVYEVGENGAYEIGDKVAVMPIIPCKICNGCKKYGPFHCENYEFLGSRNDGGFAEFCLVPEENLFKLPENVSLKSAAFIEPMLVSLHVIRNSRFKKSSNCVVFGAGPIGLITAMWLRFLGAEKVYILDIREYSINIARNCGFEEAYNLKEENFNEITKTISNDNIDFIYEAAGSSQALNHAFEIINPKGTITVVGRDTKDTVIPVSVFEKFMRKEIKLQGCWGYNQKGEDEVLAAALSGNDFMLEELVSHIVTPEESPETIKQMINKEIEFCKVMIRF